MSSLTGTRMESVGLIGMANAYGAMEDGHKQLYASGYMVESDRSIEASAVYCGTARQLLDAFAEAVQGVVMLHEQQFLALLQGDCDAGRFDIAIHEAIEAKQNAKYHYLAHLDQHGCSSLNNEKSDISRA